MRQYCEKIERERALIREKQLQEEYAKKQFEMKADLVRRTQLQIQQQQQLMREKRKLQKAGKLEIKPNVTMTSPLVKYPQQTTQRVLFPRPPVNPRVSPGANEILPSLQRPDFAAMQGMYTACGSNYTRENAQVVTHLQQTCNNAVPTTCEPDVFALLVPNLLTTCYKVVELNRLVISCFNNLLSSWNSTICQQVVSDNLVATW